MSNVSKIALWEEFYRSGAVVEQYARLTSLQAPERAIFDAIGPALKHCRLLDLGVGGGRTTHELIRRCDHYVGADYAEPMVAACRSKFADQILNHDVRFEVADARALPFADASFDVVFFSFNGIDLVGADSRATALAECRRVLRPGGHFVYSSHNLNWLDSRRNVRWEGLRDYLETQRFWSAMRRINREIWPISQRSSVELVDPYGGGLTCYVRPEELLRQTRACGFDRARVFDLNGLEVQDSARVVCLTDAWVYVMCQRPVLSAGSVDPHAPR